MQEACQVYTCDEEGQGCPSQYVDTYLHQGLEGGKLGLDYGLEGVLYIPNKVFRSQV